MSVMEFLELVIEDRVLAEMALVLAGCAVMSVVLCWICELIDPDDQNRRKDA